MPKIIKNGISYTQDISSIAASLTNGSTTIGQNSGILDTTAGYVRGDSATGAVTSGLFKIYSGTTDPASSLGQNGDIYLKRISS